MDPAKTRNIVVQGVGILAVGAIFSQFLGFFRDKLLTHIYGAGASLDAYYAAFRVPEFIYLSIGSFVGAAVLIPLIAKRIKDNDGQNIWFRQLIATFIIFFFVVYGFIIIFLPDITHYIYKNQDIVFQTSFIFYARILIISTFFLSISSIVSSLAQYKQAFIRVGLAPIFYNLGAVLGILFLQPRYGITGVCIGIVFGSFLHFLIQCKVVPHDVFKSLFSAYSFSFNVFRETIYTAFPRTISLAASALSFFLISYFASQYQAGSVTVVQLGFTLQTVFHTLIGISFATAVFPVLSRAHGMGDTVSFTETKLKTIRQLIFYSVPTTILVALMSVPMVRILFGSGKFSWEDIYLTSWSLALFIISLFAQNTILLFSRIWYAQGKQKMPFVINTMVVVIFSISFLILNNFIHSVLVVPISYTTGQWVTFFVIPIFYDKTTKHDYIKIKQTLFHSLIASIFAGLTLYFFRTLITINFNLDTFIKVAISSILAGCVFIGVWAVFMSYFKDEFLYALRIRLKNLLG